MKKQIHIHWIIIKIFKKLKEKESHGKLTQLKMIQRIN